MNKFIIVLFSLPILFVIGEYIQNNLVLCNFGSNQLTIQGTDNISCYFHNDTSSISSLDSNSNNNSQPTGVCFDSTGESCTPSKENKYQCSLGTYMTCVSDNYVVCYSSYSSCGFFNQLFYGNGQLLNSNQFKSSRSSNSTYIKPSYNLLFILLIMILIIFNLL